MEYGFGYITIRSPYTSYSIYLRGNTTLNSHGIPPPPLTSAPWHLPCSLPFLHSLSIFPPVLHAQRKTCNFTKVTRQRPSQSETGVSRLETSPRLSKLGLRVLDFIFRFVSLHTWALYFHDVVGLLQTTDFVAKRP